jgi:hypothetical protein
MGTNVRWLNTMADGDCAGPGGLCEPPIELTKEPSWRFVRRPRGATRRHRCTKRSRAPFQLSPGRHTRPVEVCSTPHWSARVRARADTGTLASLGAFELLRARIAHPLAEALEPALRFAPATIVAVARAGTSLRRVARLTGVPASSTHHCLLMGSAEPRVGAQRVVAPTVRFTDVTGTRRALIPIGLLALLVNRARRARRVGDLTIQGVMTTDVAARHGKDDCRH